MPAREGATGIARFTGVFLLLALVLWGAGVTLPVLTVTQLYLFEDTFSLFGAVGTLFDEGEVLVGVIVALFTIVLPPAKLCLGFVVWRWTASDGRIATQGIRLLEAIGRWAMLDVLVIAILIVTMKTSWLADVQTAPGLYCFAASAILALFAGMGLHRSLKESSL